MSEETYSNEEIQTNENTTASFLDENQSRKKGKKKKKVSISTILLVVIMLVGATIFLYPSISDWWNSMQHRRYPVT